MTKTEKRRFIRELSRNIVKDILAKVPNMPDEWDGHELRRYMADQFEDASMTIRRHQERGKWPIDRKRLRNFDNEVIVRNL